MSYNSLFGLGSHSPDANLDGWWPLQDNAASTVVVDQSGNGRDGTTTANTDTLDVAGPNTWLVSALDFAGMQRVSLPTDLTANGQTLLAWIKCNTGSPLEDYWFGQGTNATSYTGLNCTSEGGMRIRHGGGFITYGSLTPNAWNHISVVIPGGTPTWNNVAVRGNGSALTGTRGGGTDGSVAIGTAGPYISDVGQGSAGGNRYDGAIAGLSRFSRALTTGESDEAYGGPEPTNTVAPVVSGTETEGETLSCTSGTWGLDAPFSSGSNGTITYSYQWTRSDDGSGTGEANIGGATSSTYELTGSDVGKYIRCWVRGTNDGGADVDADTASNFTGSIAGTGGGFQAYWARRPAQLIGGGVC
jgi:hypothetical protein